MASAPTLEAVLAGGKPAVARALAAIEAKGGTLRHAAFLDAARGVPRGRVLGVTGPPGVGKSTLTNVLISEARTRGERVAVIAVDPSSRQTMGALLGDRTRLRTDPEDEGVFVRSFAARDRLGGLSDAAIAATVVMRAAYDLVIVETVGIGQSEADIALVADTVLLCVQPGSGDSLQFMKAGVMELPDVIVVTKADLGGPASRARADVEGALSLAATGEWRPEVLMVSSAMRSGMDELHDALGRHAGWLAVGDRLARKRADQESAWVEDVLRDRFGREGLRTWLSSPDRSGSEPPFERMARASAVLAARLGADDPAA